MDDSSGDLSGAGPRCTPTFASSGHMYSVAQVQRIHASNTDNPVGILDETGGVENTLNETNGSVGMAVATLLHWLPLDMDDAASGTTPLYTRDAALNP